MLSTEDHICILFWRTSEIYCCLRKTTFVFYFEPSLLESHKGLWKKCLSFSSLAFGAKLSICYFLGGLYCSPPYLYQKIYFYALMFNALTSVLLRCPKWSLRGSKIEKKKKTPWWLIESRNWIKAPLLVIIQNSTSNGFILTYTSSLFATYIWIVQMYSKTFKLGTLFKYNHQLHITL